MEKEIWVDVFLHPYNENYEVSNKGRVRRKARKVKYSNGKEVVHKERILNGGSINGKWRSITMSHNGKTKDVKVSHLVYISFNKGVSLQEDMVIDHIDSDPSNDCLENLQMITQYENVERSLVNKYNLPKHISITGGKFNVQKSIKNKVKSYGRFETLEQAIKVRDALIDCNWGI